MHPRTKLHNNDRSNTNSRKLSVLPRYVLGEARRTKTEHSARGDTETTNTRDNGNGIIRVDSETQFVPLQPMSARISKTIINICISKRGANEKTDGSSKLKRKNKIKYNEKTVGDKKKRQSKFTIFLFQLGKRKFMFQKKNPNSSWWELVDQKRSSVMLGLDDVAVCVRNNGLFAYFLDCCIDYVYSWRHK